MGAEHLTMENNHEKKYTAGLTTNMIANMGKGKHISMETLLRICNALNCDISDVIELEQDESTAEKG